MSSTPTRDARGPDGPPAAPDVPPPGGPARIKKGAGDYARALRRRLWLVLLLTAVLGGGGVLFTLFVQQPVYAATAQITIDVPRSFIEGLKPEVASGAVTQFVANRVELITSRPVLNAVFQDLALSDWKELHGIDDKIGQLAELIRAKPVKNTNLVNVTVESVEQQLAQKIANKVVEAFIAFEQNTLKNASTTGQTKVKPELDNLTEQLRILHNAKAKFEEEQPNFISGQSTEEKQLALFEAVVTKKEEDLRSARVGRQQFLTFQKSDKAFISPQSAKQIEEINLEISELEDALAMLRARLRPHLYSRNQQVVIYKDRLAQLKENLKSVGRDELEFRLQELEQVEQIAAAEAREAKKQLEDVRRVVNGQNDNRRKINSLRDSIAKKETAKAAMEKEAATLQMRQNLVEPQITKIAEADLPRLPARPIYWLQVPLCLIGGMILGVLAVVGLESSDRRIRRPEQLGAALDWPLLGVVPRLARRELTRPGGGLVLASELPGTQPCEAFRNLRMGLVGAEGDRRFRSIVVASAKADEGKSMVAANLAATCARAGETVCLIDIDLRNPTLGESFRVPDDHVGLIEVLEGSVPTGRALFETEVPNLVVLPTGNADGVPMDILGTVEMHDLLADLTERFDRVILDGPPMLGLADSRAVGRFADGVLVVARAGANDPGPLARLQQLVRQEGLRVVGVVFNGLRDMHDDLSNYGRLRARKRPAAAVRPANAAPAQPAPEEEVVAAEERQPAEVAA